MPVLCIWGILSVRCQRHEADASCHLESSVVLDVRGRGRSGRETERANLCNSGFRVKEPKETLLGPLCPWRNPFLVFFLRGHGEHLLACSLRRCLSMAGRLLLHQLRAAPPSRLRTLDQEFRGLGPVSGFCLPPLHPFSFSISH